MFIDQTQLKLLQLPLPDIIMES